MVKKFTHNPVKQKLRAGKPAVGTWLSLCSAIAAETMGHIGWDWLVVDVQHSPIGHENMVRCFQAITLTDAVPMARVAWNDPIAIQRVLDAGAFGIVVPMVNSAEDAKRAVGATKYAPQGYRSSGGGRLGLYVDDLFTWSNEELLVVVMIEHIKAVEAAKEILSVEGVDACFIGPGDLAASMGFHPREATQHPEHEEAIMRVLEAGKEVGTPVGKHCYSAEEIRQRIAQGFQFLAFNSDARFLNREAEREFAKIKDLLA